MLEWLNGKKTYIAAVLTFLGGVGAFMKGVISLPELYEIFQVSIIGVFLRAGVKGDTGTGK